MERPRSRASAILPAGLCLLLSIRTGAADPAEPIARTVTLEEAVASADRAPEMSAAQAGERVAGAGLRAARAFPDPEIGLITNSINAREAFSLLLPLPWPARARRIEAAAANLETAGRSRDEARASVRQALRAAWFMLAAEEDRARAAADRQARAQRNAEAIAALLAEGRVARLEQVRAQAEIALARSESASVEEALRSAGTSLAAMMGLEAGSSVTTGGVRPLPGPEGDLEETLRRARESSPEIRLQAAAAAAAASRLRLARRLRIPSLGLNLGAEWNDPTQDGANSFVGVSLAIPFSGPAAEAAALGERDQQAALLDRERRDAALAARTAWGRARAARLRFEAIDTELLPAARQTADLTRLAYQEGKLDLFRLLDAERLLSEAAVDRAGAYEAWGVAQADLLRATGKDEP